MFVFDVRVCFGREKSVKRCVCVWWILFNGRRPIKSKLELWNCLNEYIDMLHFRHPIHSFNSVYKQAQSKTKQIHSSHTHPSNRFDAIVYWIEFSMAQWLTSGCFFWKFICATKRNENYIRFWNLYSQHSSSTNPSPPTRIGLENLMQSTLSWNEEILWKAHKRIRRYQSKTTHRTVDTLSFLWISSIFARGCQPDPKGYP